MDGKGRPGAGLLTDAFVAVRIRRVVRRYAITLAGIVIAAPLPLVGRGSLTQATAFQILPIAYNPAVRRGAEALLLDCIGFVEAHRRQLAHASGLPVILSNALMAKLVGEMDAA